MAFLIALVGSSPGVTLSTSVAPKVFAISSLPSLASMARIFVAPAMAAPCTTFSPTPPQPNTTTTEPGLTRAVLNTAPTPVVTAQPTRAARSSGMPLSIFTRLSTDSVAYSAITPQPENTDTGLPAASLVRSVPSGSVVRALPCSTHSTGRPPEQKRHWPHM